MTIKLSDLASFNDVSEFLGITTGYLKKLLIDNATELYTSFSIPKKSGGIRVINKPSKKLIVLQYKLKKLLEDNFNPHSKAHGFVCKKDFISNAHPHVSKRFVLNIDLEDFFHSISFSRVRNMFIKYFKVNNVAATTLANLCCHPDGFLPQGSPTSPIISNIIMKTLDKDLTQLVKQHGFTFYTRYVDDITISSNNSAFPKEIAYTNPDRSVVLSTTLLNIINNNGFKINNSKIRLQSSKENQTVTGLTVNKKININRRYIKKIRAILHSFEINEDVEIPLEKFIITHKICGKSIKNIYSVFSILKGRILHVAHVRGFDDTVFQKLADYFNRIAGIRGLKISILNRSEQQDYFYNKNVFVIDQGDVYCNYFDKINNTISEVYYGQGTGFYLKNVGLITNFHVIKDLVKEVLDKDFTFTKKYYIRYYTASDCFNDNYARILYVDVIKDIAILEPNNWDNKNNGFEYSPILYANMKINLLGFPEHTDGSQLRSEKGVVVRKIKSRDNIRYEISPLIFAGNSGGPVLNKHNQVIGMAVKGLTSNGVVPPQIIPIIDVVKLFNDNLRISQLTR